MSILSEKNSLIKFLQDRVEVLVKENEKLKVENEAFKSDIKTLANSVSEIQVIIGIDLNKSQTMGSVLTSLTKNYAMGRLKSERFSTQIDKLQPLISKYEYLIDK